MQASVRCILSLMATITQISFLKNINLPLKFSVAKVMTNQ